MVSLLNYDSNPVATIQPDKNDYDFTIPACCIPIFFKDVVESLALLPNVEKIGTVEWETGPSDYYVYHENNKEICFYHSWVGASVSAAMLDLSIALGARKIIACGGCGVFDRDICEGNILIPTSGLRDEGTSYHYLDASVDCRPSDDLLQKIITYFRNKKLPYICGKTWTTDGFYRETKNKIEYAVQQSCISVEMEYTAFCSVAQFRNVEFAQLLYAGDIVIPGSYDERDWQNNGSTRSFLFEVAKNILMED